MMDLCLFYVYFVDLRPDLIILSCLKMSSWQRDNIFPTDFLADKITD